MLGFLCKMKLALTIENETTVYVTIWQKFTFHIFFNNLKTFKKIN